MLKKPYRLQGETQIEALKKRGREYKTKGFIIRFTLKPSPPPQFAILVSPKISPKAVDRNRLKRQVSEILRTHLAEAPKNLGALVILRHPVLKMDFKDMTDELIKFFNHFRSP